MSACFCLNILIETGPNDFQKVTAESLDLSEEQKSDNFFKQELQRVGKLRKITKVHTSLVQSRQVGWWTVTRCINCDCDTHAVHREKGASCVLIYSNLLNSEAISSLRSSALFSTIYNIVVNPNDVGEDDNYLHTYLSSEEESTFKNIRQVMSEFLRKETLAVDQRIKKFTEEQYEKLNNMKDQAYKEQDSLVRVIRSTIIAQPKPDSTNNPMAVAGSSSRPVRLTDIPTGSLTSSIDSPLLNRHSPKRQKSSPGVQTSSFDAEGLFEFEDGDDMNSQPESDIDESDKEDDREEGISIRKLPASSKSLAKSLPMDIPTFMSQAKHHSTEDLEDVLPQDDNVDIAASIKALAKSVHGDTVFGDLPRPRFSTQI